MTPHQRLGYKTQAAALAALKRVLNAVVPGAPLQGEDLRLVTAALLQHRQYARIAGPGIAQIYVALNPQYPNLSFHVRRVDGSVEIFSYRACVMHKPRTAEVRTALRHAVEDQIQAWRAINPTPKTCPLCASASRMWHVDHYRYTFESLVEGWLQIEALDDSTIAMAPKQERDCTHRLADPDLTARWQRWHAIAIAQPGALRIICAQCNLTRPCGAAC